MYCVRVTMKHIIGHSAGSELRTFLAIAGELVTYDKLADAQDEADDEGIVLNYLASNDWDTGRIQVIETKIFQISPVSPT